MSRTQPTNNLDCSFSWMYLTNHYQQSPFTFIKYGWKRDQQELIHIRSNDRKDSNAYKQLLSLKL